MENNEIYIDGVNVAGCEFYDNGSCRECDMRVPFYSDIDCYDKCNKDCSYKQLKRLEQENAELKAENELLREENLEEQKQYTEVVSANAQKIRQLKQTLQEIKRYIAEICKEECGYVQKKRCLDCDCRFGAILDLITKLEEE